MKTKQSNIYAAYRPLLLSGFISGGAVMAAELVSAKIISAYYGNSLYVWSAVLAITLGGLAGGYFLGGHYSSHPKRRQLLLLILSLVGMLMFLMPLISDYIMSATLEIPLKSGIILSSLVFVFPPLCCFGMVSPLIIGEIGRTIDQPGRVAGIVYSISTIGGILFTFGTGYFLIPAAGLKATCYIMGGLLVLALLLAFLGKSRRQQA